MSGRLAGFSKTEKLAVAGLIVAGLAHVVQAGILDIIVDEAYALAISHKFQLSFFDHPPLAFWLAGLMQMIAGPDAPVLVLRLPFVLLSFGSLYFLYLLTARTFGRAAGLWAALLWLLAPHFFFASGGWILPDGPLLFFLLLTAVTLDRVMFGRDRLTPWRGWILAGIWLGLAMLSKYHAVLFPLGVLLFLLLSPRHRGWLARPQPYAAGAIALAVFSPVVIWNAMHEWASFAFQLGRGDPGGGVSYLKLVASILGQAIYLSPWLMIIAIWAAIRLQRSGKPLAGFLTTVAAVPVVLFTVVSLWGNHNLPHWQMVGWLFLMPLAGAWLMSGHERLAGVTLGLGTALIAIGALFWTSLMYERPFQLPEAAARDGVREAASWRRLQPVLAAEGIALGDNEFLADPGWIGAAHLAEAIPGAHDIIVLGGDKRGFAFVANPEDFAGRDALMLAWTQNADATLALARKHFDSASVVTTVPFPAAVGAGLQVAVIRAQNFRPAAS